MSPTLPSTSVSIFSRLFADAVGIDPYTQAVSDVYQDLSGEGSYHGKGIYDVRAFSRVLSGRFPEEWVLSHDLIEGAHVRVGLASDIELFDEFPQGLPELQQSGPSLDSRRLADRGVDFLACSPSRAGGRGPNPLSLLNRWKILDNLRRSLLPATSLGLLLASWLYFPEDRRGRHAGGWHAAALSPPGATLHHGHHPQGVEVLLTCRRLCTTCCGRLPMPRCCRTRQR